MAQRLDVLRTLRPALRSPDGSESERHGLTLKVDMHWSDPTSHGAADVYRGIRGAYEYEAVPKTVPFRP